MSDYQVKDGRITSPGKFEGCREYVPHFWEIGLDGFVEINSGGVVTINILAEDRAKFPGAFGRRRVVRLVEDSQGFVNEV